MEDLPGDVIAREILPLLDSKDSVALYNSSRRIRRKIEEGPGNMEKIMEYKIGSLYMANDYHVPRLASEPGRAWYNILYNVFNHTSQIYLADNFEYRYVEDYVVRGIELATDHIKDDFKRRYVLKLAKEYHRLYPQKFGFDREGIIHDCFEWEMAYLEHKRMYNDLRRDTGRKKWKYETDMAVINSDVVVDRPPDWKDEVKLFLKKPKYRWPY